MAKTNLRDAPKLEDDRHQQRQGNPSPVEGGVADPGAGLHATSPDKQSVTFLPAQF